MSIPVFTPAAVAAQSRQAEINGANRAYFCGAYWRFGFHEDGVVSALAALDHFRQHRTCTARSTSDSLGTGASRRARIEFSYRLFMMYVDLAELDEVFRGRWLWSARRPALAWLRRADYLGDPARSIDAAVRDRIAAQTGTRPRDRSACSLTCGTSASASIR